MRTQTVFSIVALFILGFLACAASPNPGTIHTSGEKGLGDAGAHVPPPPAAPTDAGAKPPIDAAHDAH